MTTFPHPAGAIDGHRAGGICPAVERIGRIAVESGQLFEIDVEARYPAF